MVGEGSGGLSAESLIHATSNRWSIEHLTREVEMRFLRSAQLLCLGSLIFVLILSGCDTFGDAEQTTVVFEGVKHVAQGDAVLEKRKRGSKLTARAELKGGVLVNTAGFRQGNFFFQPVPIPRGSIFSAELVGLKDGVSQTLVRILQRGITEEQQRLEADVSALGVRAVTIEFRRNGKVVYRKENVQVGSNDTLVVGTTSSEPTSYHFKDTEEGTIVEIDYEESQAPSGETHVAVIEPAFEGAGKVKCTHVAVVIPETTASVSVQGVRLGGRKIGHLTLIEERFK